MSKPSKECIKECGNECGFWKWSIEGKCYYHQSVENGILLYRKWDEILNKHCPNCGRKAVK